MKSTKNLLDQLKPLPHFSKDIIYQLGRQLGLSDASIDTYISRFLKQKEVIRLKNGLYVTNDFFKDNRGDISYLFYLANIIRTPSYISSWAALQYYNLTTEAIQVFTSVTPKVTRTYKTKAGSFSYQSIKKDMFSGFSLAKEKFNFFIASPSKALFDLLYFRTRQFHDTQKSDIEILINELRIDISEMTKKEQANFYQLLDLYSHHE